MADDDSDEIIDTTQYGDPAFDSVETIDSIKKRLKHYHKWVIRAMKNDSEDALEVCDLYSKVLENSKGWLARNCNDQIRLAALLECGVNVYGLRSNKCAWKSDSGYVVGRGGNTNIIGRFDTPEEAVAALR